MVIIVNLIRFIKTYDVKDGIIGEIQKDKIARILVNAINKLSKANINIRKAIDGAIELRLLAPTFFHVPHRENNIVHNEQQKTLRDRLFKEKKWGELLDQILHVQNKKNAKKDRKNQKIIDELKCEENNNKNDDLNHNLKAEISEIEVNNLLTNNVVIIESNGNINENLLASKLNEIRYAEHDQGGAGPLNP